jgi:hypothetical protein
MNVSRRSILLAAVSTAALTGIETLLALPASAVIRTRTLTGSNSPNGWPINADADADGSVWTRPVAGAGSTVQVSIGDVETILVHVIRRFHYEIDSLRPDEIIGFRKAAGVKGYQLNHASGTAVDLRPGYYPVGAGGGFYPPQLAVVRDILADCEGLVKWGGDFTTPDEAHFQIDVPPTDQRVAALANKLRNWTAAPGVGAGVVQDPADRARRAAAQRLERRQSS